MATYHCRCAACGAEFTATRSVRQPPPTYCSRDCWRAGATSGPSADHTCENCGSTFRRKPSEGPARFCSRECYWRAGAPAENLENVRRARTNGETPGRKRKYVGRVAGKPTYVQRSHWVWNQAHPDDPVQPGEHIHHIDHDPSNDDLANLAKYSAEDHAALHAAEGSLAGPPSVLSRRMKAYHRANPGKARKGTTKECPVCGVEFYRPPSAKAVTCSTKCAGLLRSAQH